MAYKARRKGRGWYLGKLGGQRRSSAVAEPRSLNFSVIMGVRKFEMFKFN